jgi:hypothetical protein
MDARGIAIGFAQGEAAGILAGEKYAFDKAMGFRGDPVPPLVAVDREFLEHPLPRRQIEI